MLLDFSAFVHRNAFNFNMRTVRSRSNPVHPRLQPALFRWGPLDAQKKEVPTVASFLCSDLLLQRSPPKERRLQPGWGGPGSPDLHVLHVHVHVTCACTPPTACTWTGFQLAPPPLHPAPRQWAAGGRDGLPARRRAGVRGRGCGSDFGRDAVRGAGRCSMSYLHGAGTGTIPRTPPSNQTVSHRQDILVTLVTYSRCGLPFQPQGEPASVLTHPGPTISSTCLTTALPSSETSAVCKSGA